LGLADSPGSRYARVVPDPKSPDPARSSSKKKKSVASLQRELRDLAAPAPGAADGPSIDVKKIALRVGPVAAVVWILALGLAHWSIIPVVVAAVLTAIAAGAGIWFVAYVKKSKRLGAILRSANENEQGRKDALKELETGFKKGDVQAAIARAQLQMQEDPRAGLATLEAVDLGKQLAPVADQVRCMRATIHLQLGELPEARALVDKMELGKQQDVKTRAMFAVVAAETWGRTGQAKKAIELLDVFDPEDAALGEMRIQMWRARAFASAGAGDMRAAARALKKLGAINAQLLGMFIGAKKVHPMLQQEAKQIVMRSGAVPRKMVRQKM
jgi:hypothetical protein